MAEIEGKFRVLQEEDYDKKSPDNEIARIRLIEMMNFLDRESYHIGDVVKSFLTYDQFREVMGKTWTIPQGQNIQLSDLGVLTSVNILPDIASDKGMFGQAVSDSELLSDISQLYNEHRHSIMKGSNTLGASFIPDCDDDRRGINDVGLQIDDVSDVMPDSFEYTSFVGNSESFNGNPAPAYGRSSNEGGSFKPKSYEGNYFIKVNNSRDWEDV